MADRVQKLLAHSGVASRRKCEEFIAAGRVSVNGKIVGLGSTASKDDDIRVDGVKVNLEKMVYFALNKPRGVTTTTSDPYADRTILDLVRVNERVFPAGRLDKDSEGLVVLTNDGALMQAITHPSKGVWKTYHATTWKPFPESSLAKLRRTKIDGKLVDTKNVRIIAPDTVELSIHEGRKHVVRNLFAELGFPLRRLTRIAIGTLKLGSLGVGEWRELKPSEVENLRKTAPNP